MEVAKRKMEKIKEGKRDKRMKEWRKKKQLKSERETEVVHEKKKPFEIMKKKTNSKIGNGGMKNISYKNKMSSVNVINREGMRRLNKQNLTIKCA